MSTLLNSKQIVEFTQFAEQLAEASAKVILPHFRRSMDVDNKADAQTPFDPVTIADQDAESAIRALINARYPDHGIIGEEHGVEAARTGGEGLTWILDPIDGTRAFISGLPLWGTLIALNDGTEPVIGIVDQPYLKERFVGSPSGTILGSKTLKARSCSDLASATLSTTDPELFAPGAERDAYNVIDRQVRLRRYGYDCYAYCMLAHGLIDVVIESGLKTFDVQALIPVVKGAGGIITDWKGGSAHEGGQIIACGDARVHDEALKILSKVAL